MPGYTPPLNETTSPYQFDGTVSTGGANVTYAMSPMFSPFDFGLKAWNFPTYMATGTSTFMVVGSVYLSALHLSANVTYANIYVNQLGSTGSFTSGSCFAGVYNSAGTLVATTADISQVFGTGTANHGILSMPLATAYTPSTSGQYYTGMFYNAGGTASFPALASLVGQTAANSLTTWAGTVAASGGVTSALTPLATQPYPFSAIATTSGSAMPATFSLGSAGTTGAICYWVAMA